MSNLQAPHDLRLHPVWNHAINWTRHVGGDPYSDEAVRPNYERFLAMESPTHPYETPYQFPIEGYVLRKATLDDVELVARTLEAAGNFTYDVAKQMLTNSVTYPFSWAFVWDYNGRMLQYESVTLGLDGKCYLGHTVHIDHTRPHWFWRESQKPVWNALAAAGYSLIRSSLRRDRETWLPHVLEMYQGKRLLDLPKAFVIEFRTDADVFQGWPERKTLGPDWQYTEGDVVVTETQNIGPLQSWLHEKWKDSTRLPMIMNILDRWYNLDKATCLLTHKAGQLVDVRVVRFRRNTTAARSILVPVVGVPDESHRGCHAWAKQAGYTKLTSMITERDDQREVFKQIYSKFDYKVVKTSKYPRYTFVERELTL